MRSVGVVTGSSRCDQCCVGLVGVATGMWSVGVGYTFTS